MAMQILRALWHDYCAPYRYMITLAKAPDCPPFSTININDVISGWLRDGKGYTNWSLIGHRIANFIYNIHQLHPAFKTKNYVIMPDHVHFLLDVRERIDDHLGRYIARLKVQINNLCNHGKIFEDGFNDQLITHYRNLDDIYKYIDSNPYRLAVRRRNPEYFQRIREVPIAGVMTRGYGNPFLLRNPFKVSLVIHRADSPEIIERKRHLCLYTAANGGVVVSAFISRQEKEIRRDVEAMNGKIILLHNELFEDRGKPARHNFELCCQGRLLMLCPYEIANPPGIDIVSRSQCKFMNKLAVTFCPQAIADLYKEAKQS